MYSPSPTRLTLAFSAALAFALTQHAQAQQPDAAVVLGQAPNTTQHTKAKTLDEVVVYGNRTMTDKQSITHRDMQILPITDGNISNVIFMNPNVRFGNTDDMDNLLLGEIKPQDISIHGADPEQTGYFVDNVNINNELAIDSEVFDGGMQTVPGLANTQAYFFDASMLQRVEVQDQNISASLGGFMGGAIVAKTKQYDGTNRVSVDYRHTNDRWTSMNIDDKARSALQTILPEQNGESLFQPRFEKHFANLLIEQGITDNLGIVVGISQRRSTIEQNRVINHEAVDNPAYLEDPLTQSPTLYRPVLDKQNQKRRSDNLLFNVKWTPTLDDRIELSTRYSHYLEDRFYPQGRGNNNVRDTHDAAGATVAWVHTLPWATWTNTVAYDRFQNKRRSNASSVEVVSVSENFDPLYDYQIGGYGNSQLTQHNYHYSTELALDPIDWGSVEHQLNVGALVQHTDYRFHRPQRVDSVTVSIDNGEELFRIPSSTPAGRASTGYTNVALFAEDTIKWKQLEVRPGIRFERDDYLKNFNIAPRLVMHFKPVEGTEFTVGANRYYGRNFASLKLANAILNLNENPQSVRTIGHLKTPYAEELNAGIRQEVGNFTVRVNANKRFYKDRIVLRRLPEKHYTNGDPFKTNTYSLEISNREPWELGPTRWRTGLSFDYIENRNPITVEAGDANQAVILDGRLMSMKRKKEIEAFNSSRSDWIARMALDMFVPSYHMTWTNRFSLKAPIQGIEELEVASNTGISDLDDMDDMDTPHAPVDDIPRYRSYNFGRLFQWDMSLRYEPPVWKKLNGFVQVDVLNVLNQTRRTHTRAPISSQDEISVFTPGRQFWLRVGLNW